MSDDQNRDEPEITYEESPDLEAGDDPAAEGAVGERTVKRLRERLAACEADKAANLAGWQRAQADLANVTRRHNEERARAVALGEENAIAAVLPTLDAFEMAMGNRESWEKVEENWRRGVEMIRAQLEASLASLGVSAIGEIGETFDASRHQAVAAARAESADQDNRIVAVAQRGYARNGSVIRPAMVTVAHLDA
jgi:molecular chaperone GrpE (heat shock protein)